MFTILNRLRGTWAIMAKVTAVAFGLLVWFLFGDWQVALMVAIGYLIGESFGWGDWVGSLAHNKTKAILGTDEGANNGIRWLAQKLMPSWKEEWLEYCEVALFIRGIYWWLPTLAPLYFVGANPYILIFTIVALSIAFSLSIELGKIFPLNFEIGFYKVRGKWETDEFYYGIMQDIIIGLVLLSILKGI